MTMTIVLDILRALTASHFADEQYITALVVRFHIESWIALVRLVDNWTQWRN